jgi:hypothetical protein
MKTLEGLCEELIVDRLKTVLEDRKHRVNLTKNIVYNFSHYGCFLKINVKLWNIFGKKADYQLLLV